MRILAIDETPDGRIWHLTGFNEMFLEVSDAEAALADAAKNLTRSVPHFVITQRAFDSTQVARMGNRPLSESEKNLVETWRQNPDRQISDRSARLMLGLR
jgi:hypothetical protein